MTQEMSKKIKGCFKISFFLLFYNILLVLGKVKL